MSDANVIVVSFDESMALRVRDGAKLVAEPVSYAWIENCQKCEAGSLRISGFCDRTLAHACKHCHNQDRKDRKPIRWRLEGYESCPT